MSLDSSHRTGHHSSGDSDDCIVLCDSGGQVSVNIKTGLSGTGVSLKMDNRVNPNRVLEDNLTKNVNFFTFWKKVGKYNLQRENLGPMTKELYGNVNLPTNKLLAQYQNPSETELAEEYQGFYKLDLEIEKMGHDLNSFFNTLEDNFFEGSEGASIDGNRTLETAVTPLVEAFLHIQIGDINWAKRNIIWVKEYMILAKKKYPLLCPDYALGIKYLCTLLKIEILIKEGHRITESIVKTVQSTRYEDLRERGKATVWLARWLFLKVVETDSSKTTILSTENLKMICNLDTRNWVWPHILAMRMRCKRRSTVELIPYLDQLFDDEMLGRGWTINEPMRPFAYSILADLVHHVRQSLSLRLLNRAVIFFSCRVQDESLPLSIQTMSCKLLCNLVESIRTQSASEGLNPCEILIQMLEVLVYKFKVVAKVHIPCFLQSCKEMPSTNSEERGATDELLTEHFTPEEKPKEPSRPFSSSSLPMVHCSVTDCRTLVNTVVCTVKEISWSITSHKVSPLSILRFSRYWHLVPTIVAPLKTVIPAQKEASSLPHYVQFTVKEAEVYGRLIKWALKALDIFSIKDPTAGGYLAQGRVVNQGPCPKEEKRCFELFGATFILLNGYTFRELWSANIDLLIGRIIKNNSLQVVVQHLLGNPMTSANFTNVLIECLLQKLPEMGNGDNKNCIYLRLFKLIFGSVPFCKDNETIIIPHLKRIVNRSVEFSMTAKEPYNYFLLLRTLFNSIGGGEQDILYQEFLPLLPNLFQGLCSLHAGIHRQKFSEVIIELLLTVPVRLTNLFPFLHQVVYPLVSSLNGNPTLISKGLRTLEMCIDILAPDYFYSNFQGVKGELIESLCRILKIGNGPAAVSAFRILGKLGTTGWKMMAEHQKVKFGDKAAVGQCLTLQFKGQLTSIGFPIEKIIDVALKTLRSTKLTIINSNYRKEAWEFLKGFLLSSIVAEQEPVTNKIIVHMSTSDVIVPGPSAKTTLPFTNEKCRSNIIKAISGVFVAVSVKELAKEAYVFMVPFIRHIALVILAEQSVGTRSRDYMDPYVLIDAMTQVLAYEERNLKRPVLVALSILMNTVINILKTKDKACSLPVVGYLTQKMLGLCFERASYTKVNGCEIARFFLENMSVDWIFSNHLRLMRAMNFVLTDMTGEISAGALDIARENLRNLILKCANAHRSEENENVKLLKLKSLEDMALELVGLLVSPIENVRKESMKGLEILAACQFKSISEVMEPYVNVLQNFIPPKMILKQPIQKQLGLLETNAFCFGLRPQLFSMDLYLLENKTFICEMCDALQCDPKSKTLSPEVQMAMMRVIAQISNFNEADVTDDTNLSKERIFNLFVDIISSGNSDLVTCAYECLQNFIKNHPLSLDIARITLQRIMADNTRSVATVTTNISSGTKMIFLCQLFPGLYNQKLGDKIIGVLKRCLDCAVSSYRKTPLRSGVYELSSPVRVLSLFCRLPPTSKKILDRTISVCLGADNDLLLGNNSPLREPLMRFVIRQPHDYLDMVFTLPHIKNAAWNKFFLYSLQHQAAGDLRLALVGNPEKLISCLNIRSCLAPSQSTEPNMIQYLGLKTLNILNKFQDNWILEGPDGNAVVKSLRNLWEGSVVQAHNSVSFSLHDSDVLKRLRVGRWKEARMIAKLLLSYFKKNIGDVFLLFKLLLVFTGQIVPEFQFLKDYLENSVKEFCVTWKRKAFFGFISVFEEGGYPEELKAKIIQLILIPCMANSFEKGEVEELLEFRQIPEESSPENIVSVYLSRVIDLCNRNGISDVVRIALCQFSCLIVEHAASYIRDTSGTKLKQLVTFAWPSSFTSTCVDSISKYYGHLLLCHIITKFALNRRIVLQVFHSLLKASGVESKNVVRQALDIILPVLAQRVQDGHEILLKLTQKILVEEGHRLSILQLIVRHWKVYYPVRHFLIDDIVREMERLGMTPMSTFEQRKVAVEMAQIVIKWELERIGRKEESFEPPPEKKMKPSGPAALNSGKGLKKVHTNAVVNFLIRFACQLNEANQTAGSSGDILCKRCVNLVKIVLKPNVWAETILDLSWLGGLFNTVKNREFNLPNICTALELLTFVIGTFPKKYVQEHMKMLQQGISVCLTCHIPRVVGNANAFLTKLTSLFPIEAPTNPNSVNVQKYIELEVLYANARKVINYGLNVYSQHGQLQPLFRGLMVLKSACANNISYINGFIPILVNVFQRLVTEHLSGTNPPLVSELIVCILHLVKNRIGAMDSNTVKSFIRTTLMELIGKSTDRKLILEIIAVANEWIRNKTRYPILAEKIIVLRKIMQIVERKFSGDSDLNERFLECIHFIYTDALLCAKVKDKLRPALLSGLCSTKPGVREKFFGIFELSVSEKLYERLVYLLSYPSWKTMGKQQHFWIQQWTEFLLTTVKDTNIQLTPLEAIIPGVAHNLREDRDTFLNLDIQTNLSHHEIQFVQELETDLGNLERANKKNEEMFVFRLEEAFLRCGWKESPRPIVNVKAILEKETQFGLLVAEFKLTRLTRALSQLVYLDKTFSESVWKTLFPLIWKLFSRRQHLTIADEVISFFQRWTLDNCSSDTIISFVATLSSCSPPVRMPVFELLRLRNMPKFWHRSVLLLEGVALESDKMQLKPSRGRRDSEWNYYFDEGGPVDELSVERRLAFMALSNLYSMLREDDLLGGTVWQHKTDYAETLTINAVTHEMLGLYDTARLVYEERISIARQDSSTHDNIFRQGELELCERHWKRCLKELNEWNIVRGNNLFGKPTDVIESTWRVPNWTVVKESLREIENSAGYRKDWKDHLFRGYVAACSRDDQDFATVESCVKDAVTLCVEEWRRLPQVISVLHLGLVQAAQKIVELHEGSKIHQLKVQGHPNAEKEIKTIMKAWNFRLPGISDDLSHWSDIFTYRQHHYQFLAENFTKQNDLHMLSIHAAAQGMCLFGNIARKQHVPSVCHESLSKIYTIGYVPIIDCFQKLKQQIKCYIQKAPELTEQELQEFFRIADTTKLEYFSKEMTSEFLVLKGQFLAKIGHSDDAKKAFTEAGNVQGGSKSWRCWGDFLETQFHEAPNEFKLGVSAVTAFIKSCRFQNEAKARKYIAKILWLLMQDNKEGVIAEAVAKDMTSLPAIQWLPWIPQLLTSLVRQSAGGKMGFNLLLHIGRMCPQALYYPLRTLYLTLKIEAREKMAELTASESPNDNMGEEAKSQFQQQYEKIQLLIQNDFQNMRREGSSGTSTNGQSSCTATIPNPSSPSSSSVSSTIPGIIPPTPTMWRCFQIIQIQRSLHPSVISSLEGIVKQIISFRESWYQGLHRQLKIILAQSHLNLYKADESLLMRVPVPQHIKNHVNRLLSSFDHDALKSSTFGGPEDNLSLDTSVCQDPFFQSVKWQFFLDFGETGPGTEKLYYLMLKLQKWIKILETKTEMSSKTFLLEDPFKFLQNFSSQMSEIDLPGEFLMPKQHAHQHVKIAKFLPKVEIVQKYKSFARRIFIRGHNGKIYPYLIVKDSGLLEQRREERVMQMARMLNDPLSRQKGTAKRNLRLTVPKVVSISPQIRLVEDNSASLSLLDILKLNCSGRIAEIDTPLLHYYEAIANIQRFREDDDDEVTFQDLQNIFVEIQTYITPKTIMKEWALNTFDEASHYFAFRKMFGLQLSLWAFAEYAFNLTALYPDMMYLHKDSGLINVSYFKFNIDDKTGELIKNRQVPFRLTPNITEFLTPLGVKGPFESAMISIARCFNYPNYKIPALLRAILMDEIISWKKEESQETDAKTVINLVNSSVDLMMERVQTLSVYDGSVENVSPLINIATDRKQLSQMDPTWYPWL